VLSLDAPPDVAVARRRDGDESFDRWMRSMRSRVWIESGWSLVDLPAGEPSGVVLAAAPDHRGVP
jgi:antibiotic biosynthesis monooxygenase (ABM) superfamily enzyme